VQLDLGAEFFPRVQERQGVVVSLVEEFNAAAVGQLAEAVEDLRRVLSELLQRHAGDRIRDAKPPLVLLDGLQHHAVGRQVALVGHLTHDLGVLVVVEVVAIGVENAVSAQSEGLVHLEVKTNRSHRRAVFLCVRAPNRAPFYEPRCLRLVSGACAPVSGTCNHPVSGACAAPRV
jgi:hypothetical protein